MEDICSYMLSLGTLLPDYSSVYMEGAKATQPDDGKHQLESNLVAISTYVLISYAVSRAKSNSIFKGYLSLPLSV